MKRRNFLVNLTVILALGVSALAQAGDVEDGMCRLADSIATQCEDLPTVPAVLNESICQPLREWEQENCQSSGQRSGGSRASAS